MKAFYKYASLYGEFFKTSLSRELSFRFNFLFQSLMNISFLSMYFFTSLFIFDHVESIGPWNKTEFLFFISFVFAVDQTYYLFFVSNFWEFSEDIRMGTLDFHLLKPFHSLFTVLFRNAAIPGIFTICVSYSLLIYFGIQADLMFSIWLSLPFCILLSVFFLLGIETLISLLNFFTVEGMGINQIRNQAQHLCRWPDFIYKKPGRIYLLPFVIINSVPVRWILDTNYWNWMVFMLGGLICLWFLVFFLWPKALNFYESPSS